MVSGMPWGLHCQAQYPSQHSTLPSEKRQHQGLEAAKLDEISAIDVKE